MRGPAEIGSLADILLLIAVSTAAGYALEWIRVPAGLMLGPMLASAALELVGVISGAAPASVLIPANVVLGVMIGARFSHFTFTEFREALKEGFSGFLIALVIALAGAGIASAGSPACRLALTLLAFSPGGLDAMTIMAFALNLDPAYVGAHQMARYIGLALLMPMVTAYVLGRMGVSRQRHFAAPPIEARGPLMDQLAFLLTYKGAVVLGALALLLVAERLLPVAKRRGRREAGGARTCRSRASTRCCPGPWWCRSRPRRLPCAGLAA